MTTPPTALAEPQLPRARVGLTATDAERIATAVEAELAASTRETYDCGWRQWERWCRGRGIQSLPAPPEAVAAFLAERAEAGVHFSTLDCYCSGIARQIDWSTVLPAVSPAALAGLKFSEVLPRDLAIATIAERLADHTAAGAVDTEPRARGS